MTKIISSDYEALPIKKKNVEAAPTFFKPKICLEILNTTTYDDEEAINIQNLNIQLAPNYEYAQQVEDIQLVGEVWDNTKEFVSGIISNSEAKKETDIQLKNSHLTLKDAADGKTSVMNIQMPSEKYKPKDEIAYAHYVTETANIELPKIDTTFVDEPLINRSCAIAIKILKERNLLKEGEPFGKKDSNKFAQEEKIGEMVIEHRDKQGRILTKKEAFNLQCRSFHGISESKTRTEKRKKKVLVDLKSKTIDHGGETNLSKALELTQMAKAQPYMVIEKKRISTIF